MNQHEQDQEASGQSQFSCVDTTYLVKLCYDVHTGLDKQNFSA